MPAIINEVDFRHRNYNARIEQWTRCRDVLAGEDAVKSQNVKYLPRLKKQPAEDYEAYLTRAEFYEASKRTLEGFVGAVMRKEPSVEGPSDIVKRMERMGSGGEDMEGMTRLLLRELLTTRWGGAFIDSGESDRAPPYASIYAAEDVINWRRREIDGRDELVLVVLSEIIDRPDGPFVSKEVKLRRVLQLVGPGDPIPSVDKGDPIPNGKTWRYFVSIYEFEENKTSPTGEKWRLTSVVEPKRWGGKGFDRIPFRFLGTGLAPPEPPMLGLVNMNLSHYRTSADLEHGRHMTALPTPVLTGFDDTKIGGFYIGSGKAWVTDNESARATFLEFSGAGLASLEKAQEQKEARMAVLGGRLLEEQKASAEAAATVRLRQAGESSVLAEVAKEASTTLTWMVTEILAWQIETGLDVNIELNRDFNILGLAAQEMQTLMAMTQGNLMSWETFFWNLQRGEVVPDGRTSKDELALISAGGPVALPGKPSPQGPTSRKDEGDTEDDEEDDEEDDSDG